MLYICFPTYNEEQNVEKLLRRIAGVLGNAAPYQVVAYDDGSTDNTQLILEHCQLHHPLHILHSDENKGLGHALNQLIAHVCKNAGEGDIAIFMDGDDTHDPYVIEHMTEALKRGADVVIASRYAPGSIITGLPSQRVMLSRASSLFWRIVMPIEGVRDYTSGFRAYRVSVLKRALAARGDALITRPGFECQAELLFRLNSNATHFTEVPIKLAYERKYSASKMKLASTALHTISLGMSLLFARG